MTYWVYWILIILSFVCLFFVVAYSREIGVTTCRLASQILQDNTRVCVYVGANYTQWNEYVPIDAGECPREIRCKYRPNEKPFTLKNVIKSIKDSFK